MPLAHPLVAICTGLYLVAVAATLWLTGSPGNAGQLLWQPSQEILYSLGMGGRIPLLQGRVWTLFTATYLHGSLPHLALNMFSLIQVMPMVERAFGRLRAFVIYAIGGLVGALASVIWGEAFSLGASGALFGLLGAIVFYGFRRGDAFGRALMTNAAFWAGLNFLFGLINPGISNAGHFGGFLGGLAAAVLIARRTGPFMEPRRLAFVLASLTLLSLAVGVGNTASLGWQISTDKEGFLARRLDDLSDRVDTILATDPANTDALFLRASILAQRDDYAGALRDIELAIKGGRNDAAALNLRAWSLYKLGRAEDGLDDAEAAVRAAPDEAAIIDTRAHIYEALGRREEAIADYKAALRLNPDEPETQAGLRRLTGE